MHKHRTILSSVTSVLLVIMLLASTASSVFAGAPLISGLDITSAGNDANTTIILTGSGFELGSEVLFDQTPAANIIWEVPNRLIVSVPWGLPAGRYDVTVRNLGGETHTLADAFEVTDALNRWTTGGPYGGGIFDLVATSQYLVALVDSAGIYRRPLNGGAWQAVLPAEGASQIVADPHQPGRLYASVGSRIQISSDHGATWTEVSPYPDPYDFDVQYAYTITADPFVPGRLFVAARSPSNRPDQPQETGEVYRSTDYGLTWQEITHNIQWDPEHGIKDTQAAHIAADPNVRDRLVLASRSGAIYESLNAGESWTLKTRRENTSNKWIYFNPFNPGQYLLVVDAHVTYGPPYLHTSTDLVNWSPVGVENTADPYNDCWIDKLSFADGKVWASCGSGFTSTNGQAWTKFDHPLGGNLSVAAAAPGSADHLFAGSWARNGDFSGVIESTDGGATWKDINTGLSGVVTYSIAVSSDDLDEAYAYTNIHGLVKTIDGGRSWRGTGQLPGDLGHGWGLLVPPLHPHIVLIGRGVKSNDFNKDLIRYSTDRGRNWSAAAVDTTGLKTYEGLPAVVDNWNAITRAFFAAPLSDNLYAHIFFGPENSNNCAAHPETCATGLFHSVDHGVSWALLPTPAALGSETPTAIHFDPVDEKTYYLMADHLWVTRDSGATWTQRATPLNPDNDDPYFTYFPARVVTHPEEPGVLLMMCMPKAAFGGAEYISRDYGATWTLTTGANTVIGRAPTGFAFYNGTDAGLMVSNDEGLRYHRMTGSPDARIHTVTAAWDMERSVVYTSSSTGFSTSIAVDPQVKTLAESASAPAVVPGGVYRVTQRLNGPAIKTIKIGMAADLTGGASYMGSQDLTAVELAFEQINQAGGLTIGGETYLLELVVVDNGTRPSDAVTVANQLVNAGVKAVIGHTIDQETDLAAQVYKNAGIPVIIPRDGASSAAHASFGNIFRMAPKEDAAVYRMAEHLVDKEHRTRAAVLAYAPTFAPDADRFDDIFKAAGGTFTGMRGYSTAAELNTALDAIQAEKPQVIYYADIDWNNYAATLQRIANLRAALDARGMKDVFIATYIWDNEPWKMAGLEGMVSGSEPGIQIALAYRPYAEIPGWENFTSWYSDYSPFSGLPDYMGVFAYDAARLLANVIESKQSAAPADILAGLKAMQNYPGLAGTYTRFDDSGDIMPQWGYVKELRGGQWLDPVTAFYMYLPALRRP